MRDDGTSPQLDYGVVLNARIRACGYDLIETEAAALNGAVEPRWS
jgi:hypothetical protein